LPTLIFDEVVYSRLAQHYVLGEAFFHNHPPLGKYLIALGISLNGFNPVGCRWINALLGSLIPLLVGGIAYQIAPQHRYALIAAGLSALDGLLLVESRYALLNIYVLFFGLLGQWFFLRSRLSSKNQAWLFGAGLSFGTAVAVKWNGLLFLSGAIGVWGTTNIKTVRSLFPKPLNIRQATIFLGVIPLAAYTLLWLPHLTLNPGVNLWQLHQKMFAYHSAISHASHTYCSAWYTWPLMLRPIRYFHQISTLTPDKTVIYDVRAMGNPILWWLATFAIAITLFSLGRRLFQSSHSFSQQDWPLIYCSINYLTSWLPWVFAPRCTFIYHYLPAACFSFLILAWCFHQWLNRNKLRQLAYSGMILIAIAFGFWLPMYLGLPLSPQALRWRLLLTDWL